MKYTFALFLLLIFGQATAHENITYFIADKSTAPFQISDSKTNKKGIITDIINAISDDEISFKHEILPFKRMIKNMEETDKNWISYGSKAWSEPQSTSLSNTVILTVKHSFLTLKNTNYHQLSDLFGQRLVLIRGFDYPGLDNFIQQNKFEIMYVKDHEAALKAVLYERAIAFPDMNIRLNYHINQLKLSPSSFSLHSINSLVPDYDINLCYSKNFPIKIRDRIEKSMIQMKENNELNTIVSAYAY